MGAGIWITILSYVRLRRIIRAESNDKRKQLIKALGFKPPEQEYKYLIF